MKSTVAILAALLLVGVIYGRPLLGQPHVAEAPAGPVVAPATNPPQVPVAGTPATVAPGSPSTPAVVTTTVPNPAAPSHAMEQAEWALAMAFLFQAVKKTRWITVVSPETSARAQAVIGAVLAAVTAAGIHFAVSGNILDGGVNISVTGVSIDALKDVGWQWVCQQAWYQKVVKESV